MINGAQEIDLKVVIKLCTSGGLHGGRSAGIYVNTQSHTKYVSDVTVLFT